MTSKLQSFGPMVASNLKEYVYALCDPRKPAESDDYIFYIGKGQGDRCFNHASEKSFLGERKLEEHEHKLSLIREILDDNKSPLIKIVAYGLSSEEAFRIEAILIPLFGFTNMQKGHKDQMYWQDISSIHERYDQPIQRHNHPELVKTLLFVSLQKQDISELKSDIEKMKRHTLGDWNIGCKRARLVDLVIGTRNQLVVSVFETEKDTNGKTLAEYIPASERGKHGRHIFAGTRRPDLEQLFCGRSIHEGELICTKMPSGAGYRYRSSLI